MKSRFHLGFLSGYKDVPKAWPGTECDIPLLEPSAVYASDSTEIARDIPQLKKLTFRCTKIDDDHSAVFEFMGVK